MWHRPSESSRASHREHLPAVALAAVCALGLALNIWIALLNQTGLGVDFNQFYSASRLAGTGHLYDWDALRKIEAENGLEVPTGRLPVVIYGYRIFGGLPYTAARATWMVLSIAALAAFAAWWPGARPQWMGAALAWSLPVTFVILFGQDVPFWLMFFAMALVLLERKKEWSAGVVFSLCICKFHLALGIPILLVARKCWKTLIGGAIGVSVWIGASFLLEGPGWPMAYLKMSHMPTFSPAADRMPNVYGIASWIPWTSAAEVAGGIAVALLLWTVCRRGGTGLGMAGAAAAACGVLLGHHSYAGDCALLIPLTVLTVQRPGAPRWLKIWAVATLTPAPVLLLLSNRPLLAQLWIAAFVVTAVWLGRGKAPDVPAPAYNEG
ncbi:MAG: DUF2029 domain-containing protein [Acidobacteria bacterium]|nr:DUF2029 domain-containing protein [Acidobacteriota bacterium]